MNFLRLGLFSLLLPWLTAGSLCQGGDVSYTDRGKTDFDTALEMLNPYGTWSQIKGTWAYTPLDHQTPYTHGRWLYTEYGWYWKGDQPESWVTEHYGYWKRGEDQVWSWYPGPFWLPEIVELRATSTHIGWRSAAVDRDSDYIEKPADRYAKTDEWTFVTRAQFAGPITPHLIAGPDDVKQLLDDSTEATHTYLTYREIDRPGPHPADFLSLGPDGGMFAPRTLQDIAAAQKAAAPPIQKLSSSSPKSAMTGTNAPALLGMEADPNADPRQVKYWITMSLPTYWTEVPATARPGELYLYRPDFYQDQDGIARRILLWFNPRSRTTLQEVLGGHLSALKSEAEATNNTPPEPAKPSNPFGNPFDGSYHPKPTDEPAQKPLPADPQAPVPLPLLNTNASSAHH